MCIKERLPKKTRYKAFVYPYYFMIACLCFFLIISSTRETQMVKMHTDNTIHFQLNKDLQQYCKSLIEASLEDRSWLSCVSWIQNHPCVYADLNCDSISDSVCYLTYFGLTGQIAEIGVSHYLLKSEFWGNSTLPVITIPLETNLSKRIKVLPNRYNLTPRYGLLYQIDTTQFSILSVKKISLLHTIE